MKAENNMIDEKSFKKILFEGTYLIKKLVNGEIELQQFIEKYADFYYYNALDGHESNEEYNLLLKKYARIVELHKRIQTEVIDLVYHGNLDQMPQYITAGRITLEQALNRITDIANFYEIDNLLLDLGMKPTKRPSPWDP